MASNFRILAHRNNDTLYLRLLGDFDGSSAFELINALKAHDCGAGQVVVDTCGLSSLHPFGLGVFQKKSSMNILCRDLAFTGKYGDTMVPQRSELI